jgi:hypothetical protein
MISIVAIVVLASPLRERSTFRVSSTLSFCKMSAPPFKSRVFLVEAEAEYVEWAGGRVLALGRVMEVYGVVPREDVPGCEWMYEVEGTFTVR